MNSKAAPVVISASDSRWPETFEAESARIREALRLPGLEVHHIGSTSVPGLAAKPIIDILLATPVPLIRDEVESVCALGYGYLGENGIPDRQYFSKPGFHVHGFPNGHPEVRRHLAFRDYLRTHPDIAGEYEMLKRRLAEEFRENRVAYTDGKSDFVRRIDALAASLYE